MFYKVIVYPQKESITCIPIENNENFHEAWLPKFQTEGAIKVIMMNSLVLKVLVVTRGREAVRGDSSIN